MEDLAIRGTTMQNPVRDSGPPTPASESMDEAEMNLFPKTFHSATWTSHLRTSP